MHRRLRTWLLGLLLTQAFISQGWAQISQPSNGKKARDGKPLRFYIAVDSEGPTGVNEYWARNLKRDSPALTRYRQLVTDDVNAAVAGCFAGGADEVYVKDDGFRDKNLFPEKIDKRARILPPGGPLLNGLDSSFAGVLLVGFHAMEGARDGVLAHTWSSARRRRYWFNDQEGGEVVVYAIVSGHDHKVPIVMATGCAGLCREVRQLLGNGVVTVAVKSVSPVTGQVQLLAPEVTLPRIRAGARQAVQQSGMRKPYQASFPMKVRLQLSDKPTTDGYLKWRRDNKPDWPGRRAGPRTIEAELTTTKHLNL